jgi:hypothetical protein
MDPMGHKLGLVAVLAAGLLTACGSGEGETVGGVTADEATQLNNAAEMLDASPDGLAAPEDVPLDVESNSGDAAGGGNIG